MIAKEHSRLVLKGIRQAASVGVHWSLVVQNYAQPGNEKSITILTKYRRPGGSDLRSRCCCA
jgi:hypothetical protein